MKQQQCSIVVSKKDFSLYADFVLPTHGVLGIFGHSGSGKTTLLRCIAGLEKNITGNISFHQQQWLDDSYQLSTQDRRIGYVFQESRLFSHLTVKENIEYGEKRAEKLPIKDKSNLLLLLNIVSPLSRYPSSLAGEEKQRVAIARAFCKNPQILLMVEPLASLDETHKHEILKYLEGDSRRSKAIEEIKKNSRRYAKRQLTWFRRDTNIKWFAAGSDKDILAYINSQIDA